MFVNSFKMVIHLLDNTKSVHLILVLDVVKGTNFPFLIYLLELLMV